MFCFSSSNSCSGSRSRPSSQWATFLLKPFRAFCPDMFLFVLFIFYPPSKGGYQLCSSADGPPTGSTGDGSSGCTVLPQRLTVAEPRVPRQGLRHQQVPHQQVRGLLGFFFLSCSLLSEWWLRVYFDWLDWRGRVDDRGGHHNKTWILITTNPGGR